jgi:hypothetical protein
MPLLDALLMIALPSVSAFGARLEPFASQQGGFSSSRGGTSSLLRVDESKRPIGRSTQSPHSSHETDEAVLFQHILDDFDFPPAAYQNLNDFTVAQGMIDGTFFHLREQADLLASETFGANLLAKETPEVKWMGADDDEEECLIPEEWKILPTMMESIDVMEFLGITRARPLMMSTIIYPDS